MAKKFEINIKTIFSKAGINNLISGLDRGIKRAHAFGAALRKGMHSAPVRILRNSLAFLVGTLAAGTMQAAKFNIELARAWTMSSKGKGWFSGMRNSLRELSAELGIAKDQLSGGLYAALSAGVPDDNVLSFLGTAGKIAVADGSDVAVVVDGLTTVLNAFKIEASETDAVADQMFNTVANGKTAFGELAQTLATVAPLAAANEIAFNEVLAAVASLTKQGTPTAQAMTQIRAAIDGTNKVLGDGWAKTMSLQEAFKKVEEQAGGSQTALKKMLGTTEGVMAVLGMTGINAQMAAADLESTADAAGSVESAFQKVDQFRHWNKLWQNISGLVERTAQEADSRLAPAILRIVEDIASVQDNDTLWAGLGVTLDEAQERISSLFEYIKSEGKGGAVDLMEDVGSILTGHAKNAAQDAMQIMATSLPKLGTALGKYAADYVQNKLAVKALAAEVAGVQTGPEPSTKGLSRSERKEAKEAWRDQYDENLKKNIKTLTQLSDEEQGKDLARDFGSGDARGWGQDDIDRGVAGVVRKVVKGDDIKEEGDAKRWSPADQEIADEYLSRNKDADKAGAIKNAESLYRRQRQQESAAESNLAVAGLHGRGVADAQSTLDRERQQTAEVAALIRAVQAGDNGLTAQMLAALQAVVANQAVQAAKIEQNASQIKNGRS